MKDLAIDESLSEEARDSARKALEVLVSSQLLDIEQAAALKKRAGTLKDLESEALFVDQQAQIENRKLEAAALAEVQKMELEAQAKRKKAATERLQKLEAGVEEEMLEWLERHRLSRHADAIAKAAGRDAAPADLLYLTEEDVAEIGALLLAPTALALTG